jgi:hypothetical protein
MIFRRGRGRPTKKVVKSSQFIDDEAEERQVESSCFRFVVLDLYLVSMTLMLI